jgi:hypothetical protein
MVSHFNHVHWRWEGERGPIAQTLPMACRDFSNFYPLLWRVQKARNTDEVREKLLGLFAGESEQFPFDLWPPLLPLPSFPVSRDVWHFVKVDPA